ATRRPGRDRRQGASGVRPPAALRISRPSPSQAAPDPRDPLLAARLVTDSKPDAPADPVLDVFTQRCVWCLLPPRDPPLEGSAGQPGLGRFGRLHAGRSGRLGKDLMLAAAVGTMWRPLIAADALA